jgi:hypothetical protein
MWNIANDLTEYEVTAEYCRNIRIINYRCIWRIWLLKLEGEIGYNVKEHL